MQLHLGLKLSTHLRPDPNTPELWESGAQSHLSENTHTYLVGETGLIKMSYMWENAGLQFAVTSYLADVAGGIRGTFDIKPMCQLAHVHGKQGLRYSGENICFFSSSLSP